MLRGYKIYRLDGPFWTFPIQVRPVSQGDQTGMAIVRLPEIPLLNIQREAIEVMLTTIGSRKGDKWWLIISALDAVATLLPDHTEPEEVVHWNPSQSNNRYEDAERDDPMAAFAKSYADNGGLLEPAAATVVWASMCQYALHSLINLQRPVPMGFCNLVPFLFRHNWLDVVFCQEGKERGKNVINKKYLNKITDNIKWNCTEAEIIQRGGCERLTDEKLVALNDELFPQWTLSVEFLKPWFHQSMATESTKLRKYRRKGTDVGYWRSVLDTLKRQLPNALKIYSQYLEATQQKNPHLPQKSISRPPPSVAGIWRRYGEPQKRCCCRFQDYDRYDFIKGAEVIVVPEDEGVSEMPDLPSQEPDVRASGGTSGVQVLVPVAEQI